MYLSDCPLGLYEKALPFEWDFERKLETVKELGFDFMEFSVDPDHTDRLDWSEKKIADFKKVSMRLGVPVLTMALSANRACPLGSKHDHVREEGKVYLKKAILLAVKLGVRIVQVAAYDVYELQEKEGNEENDRLFLESITECARFAARSGVMLALETMDTPYAGSVERCKRIVDIVGSPWVQIYADTGNIAAAGIDFTKDILTGAPHVVAVHLKDSKPGMVRHIHYGNGIVDFDADLKALKETGFQGFFIAEMWYDVYANYIGRVKESCLFLRDKIKAADSLA